MSEEKTTEIAGERESVFSKTWALVLFALIACALWGSAFPGVKTGYELFGIETTGSRILFAGYRFTAAGIITLIIVSVFEGHFVTIKKSSVPYIFAQGMLQTTVQYVFFYIGLANTTGIKGSVIRRIERIFFYYCGSFHTEKRKNVLKEGGHIRFHHTRVRKYLFRHIPERILLYGEQHTGAGACVHRDCYC